MKRIKGILLLLALICIAGLAQAQQEKPQSLMRSDGRIYVVIAVILTILAGLILYLVMLDRKISRFEKSQQADKTIL